MAELVVVEAARELRLLQVGGDMLVWHLLHARLEEISFLQGGGFVNVPSPSDTEQTSQGSLPHPRSTLARLPSKPASGSS